MRIQRDKGKIKGLGLANKCERVHGGFMNKIFSPEKIEGFLHPREKFPGPSSSFTLLPSPK